MASPSIFFAKFYENKMAAAEKFDILWLQDARKRIFAYSPLSKTTFTTHHGHCHVVVLVSSQPKASNGKVAALFWLHSAMVGALQVTRVRASAATQWGKRIGKLRFTFFAPYV